MGESTPMAGSHRRRAQRRQRCAAAPAPPQSPDPPQLLVPAVWEAEPRWQSGDLQLEHERVGPLRPVHRGNAAPLTSACTRHLGDWGAGARPAPGPPPWLPFLAQLLRYAGWLRPCRRLVYRPMVG